MPDESPGPWIGEEYRKSAATFHAHPPEPPSPPPVTTPRPWEPTPASPERQLGSLACHQQVTG